MAIQAKDLRIGNIVFVDNEKHHPLLKDVPLEVTGISETTLDGEWTYSISLKHINQQPNKYYESYSQFIKFIFPIALTPEVLVNAGFEYGGDCMAIEISDGRFLKVFLDDFCFSIADQHSEITFYDRYLYLHDLQNLYQSLTGTELTLNLCTATNQNDTH